jgi:3-oxoacyl-[acyl-carrier-protein] synthase-3
MKPHDRAKKNETYFKMNGKKVYDFAVSKGTEIIKELINKSKIDKDDVNQFVCHQANINIINSIAKNLGVPKEKFFVNLNKYGNTASASVVIALDEVFQKKLTKKDDLVMTIGFGGGLSWGANLIRV